MKIKVQLNNMFSEEYFTFDNTEALIERLERREDEDDEW